MTCRTMDDESQLYKDTNAQLRDQFDRLTVEQVCQFNIGLHEGRDKESILDLVLPNGIRMGSCTAGYLRIFSDWRRDFMTSLLEMSHNHSCTYEVKQRIAAASQEMLAQPPQ
jgi:hypothetical protein